MDRFCQPHAIRYVYRQEALMPTLDSYRDTILAHLRTALAEVEAADDDVVAFQRQRQEYGVTIGPSAEEVYAESRALVGLVRQLGEVQARVSRW
jgi:ribosomal protein S24E